MRGAWLRCVVVAAALGAPAPADAEAEKEMPPAPAVEGGAAEKALADAMVEAAAVPAADAEAEKEMPPAAAVEGGAAEKALADAMVEAAAVPAADASPLPSRVTIALHDLPPEAEVPYDGKVMSELPLSVERGTTGATVEVRAPGYQTWRSVVVPDRDIEFAVRMEPVRQARDAGRPGRREATTGRADAGGSATAQAGVTPAPDAGARAAESGTALNQAGRGTVVITTWEDDP